MSQKFYIYIHHAQEECHIPHTHTHTHSTALWPGLPGWAGKGKTNLDFTEARDSGSQRHQLGHMQVCTSLQTDNHANTPQLCFFTGRMPFLPPNQQRRWPWLTLKVIHVLPGFSNAICRTLCAAFCKISTDTLCCIIRLWQLYVFLGKASYSVWVLCFLLDGVEAL